MTLKIGLFIASYLLAIFIGWHAHVWYTGYLKQLDTQVVLDDRIDAEKISNDVAAKTSKKEAENDKKAQASNAVVEKHIEADKLGYGCIIPATGLHDLQQAVTTHTRARKSH